MPTPSQVLRNNVKSLSSTGKIIGIQKVEILRDWWVMHWALRSSNHISLNQGKSIIIGSDNGLLPGRRQAII